MQQATLTKDDRRPILQWVNDLCRQQQTTSAGRTLLHLSVSSRTNSFIANELDQAVVQIKYPSVDTTRLLLHCGRQWIDVDAIDPVSGDTALRTIARYPSQLGDEVRIAIMRLLASAGAHLECLYAPDYSRLDVKIRVLLQPEPSVPPLKCLCARLINSERVPYADLSEKRPSLQQFILLHNSLIEDHWDSTDGELEFDSD